jgi:long-chain acyl-CoA synthetase
MNLADLLQRQGSWHPDRPAIYNGEVLHASYGQWAARSAALAQRFQAAGLTAGDRVLLFMRNHPRYLEIMWAAWWAGLVVVPVNAKLHVREVAWIVDNAQAAWGFVSADVASEHIAGLARQTDVDSTEMDALLTPLDSASQEPPVERAPDDVAWLFYTSGTTGRPKGVMITQRNLFTMGQGYFVDVDAVGTDDVIVYGAPMSHGAGLYAVPHLMAGARHAVPASGGVDAAELFALGRALGPMSTFAAPTIVLRLVEYAEQVGLSPAQVAQSWKTIVYGGAPMYVADMQRALRVMGPRFVQIYGQGESPMTITALSRADLSDSGHPRHPQRLASVGVAQTPVQVRVADASGQALPVGQAGEILVKGDTVMAGYWRNPQATADAVREGWLFTGDVGSLDADGFLTLMDRSKDLIISGGSNIYPREVEEVLLEVPGVAEVAVVGMADAHWGEVVVAFVVAQVGAALKATQLDAHCLDQLARFKRPKRYEFVDQLPKNNYGKVQKTALRDRLKNS